MKENTKIIIGVLCFACFVAGTALGTFGSNKQACYLGRGTHILSLSKIEIQYGDTIKYYEIIKK